VQDGDNVVVRASLPGVSPDDISVDIEDGVLTISSDAASENEKGEDAYLLRERRSGSFHRSLRLPDTVDANGGESSYELGVVTVTFPKVEAKKARRIEVKAK
jgi:HSP20 family protein